MNTTRTHGELRLIPEPSQAFGRHGPDVRTSGSRSTSGTHDFGLSTHPRRVAAWDAGVAATTCDPSSPHPHRSSFIAPVVTDGGHAMKFPGGSNHRGPDRAA